MLLTVKVYFLELILLIALIESSTPGGQNGQYDSPPHSHHSVPPPPLQQQQQRQQEHYRGTDQYNNNPYQNSYPQAGKSTSFNQQGNSQRGLYNTRGSNQYNDNYPPVGFNYAQRGFPNKPQVSNENGGGFFSKMKNSIFAAGSALANTLEASPPPPQYPSLMPPPNNRLPPGYGNQQNIPVRGKILDKYSSLSNVNEPPPYHEINPNNAQNRHSPSYQDPYANSEEGFFGKIKGLFSGPDTKSNIPPPPGSYMSNAYNHAHPSQYSYPPRIDQSHKVQADERNTLSGNSYYSSQNQPQQPSSSFGEFPPSQFQKHENNLFQTNIESQDLTTKLEKNDLYTRGNNFDRTNANIDIQSNEIMKQEGSHQFQQTIPDTKYANNDYFNDNNNNNNKGQSQYSNLNGNEFPLGTTMNSVNQPDPLSFISTDPQIYSTSDNSVVMILKPREFYRKKQEMMKAGPSAVQLFSDFEHVFTRFKLEDGVRSFGSAELLESSSLLHPHALDQLRAIADDFANVEMDENSFEDFTGRCQTVIAREGGLHIANIIPVTRERIPQLGLRDGWKEVVQSLSLRGVPSFIFSSGYGDIVAQTLLNSGLQLTAPNPYGASLPMASQVLGSHEDDVSMTDGLVATKEQISIGFLELTDDLPLRLPIFLSSFDVVITGDGSLREVVEILNEILLVPKAETANEGTGGLSSKLGQNLKNKLGMLFSGQPSSVESSPQQVSQSLNQDPRSRAIPPQYQYPRSATPVREETSTRLFW